MKKYIFPILFILIVFVSCQKQYVPKPRSYFRINFPEKKYQQYTNENCHISFKYPDYAVVEKDNTQNAEPCWYNIHYLPFGAKLHLTYKDVKDEEAFYQYANDANSIVYQHSVKAQDIRENLIRTKNNVGGMLYDIQGNTATSVTFYLSDTFNHYLYGSLYFDVKINRDSLDPVIEFIRTDIDTMIQSFRWVNN